ncbi:MAG TPA: nuclear transport factor 2 family protein [Pseudomonadales bacterium]|nr:nuclear transport factor 2 family protein [Pseudomonadales bacterium]
MGAKDADGLNPQFHVESKLVHMSGTWKNAQELDIIREGSIWYKKAHIHNTDEAVIGNTAVVWSRITLYAHVKGNDVSNEFTVTEVFENHKTTGKY